MASGPPDAAHLQGEVEAAALDGARAVAIQHLELAAGPGKLQLQSGVLIPAAPAGGRSLELVFVGAGRIELDPPDAIEAGQLELFTGHRRLDEEISAAVLVVGMDGVTSALLKRPAVAAAAPQLATAQEM
jgi:hypothetical protein